MTDEELNALVARLDDMSDLSRDHAAGLLDLGHKVAVHQAITAITTLRAQLAEAQRLMRLERTIADKNADRADRAEAALATAFGDGLRTAISVIASIGYGKNEDVDAGHEEALRAVEKYLIDWTSRSQPHDRTALERHDAKTREKALREAADAYFIPKFCTDNDREKVEALHAFRAAILALIEVKP